MLLVVGQYIGLENPSLEGHSNWVGAEGELSLLSRRSDDHDRLFPDQRKLIPFCWKTQCEDIVYLRHLDCYDAQCMMGAFWWGTPEAMGTSTRLSNPGSLLFCRQRPLNFVAHFGPSGVTASSH